MSDYDINREDSGKEIIYKFNLFSLIFNSNIKNEWPFNSKMNKSGADFTLENGLNIDLKNQIGERKDMPGVYRDKLVLSVFRRQEDGNFHKCLTNKITDIWFYTIQTAPDIIEFMWICKEDLHNLLKDYPISSEYNEGGKGQKYMVIDINDGRYVNKSKFYLNLVTEKLERYVNKFNFY